MRRIGSAYICALVVALAWVAMGPCAGAQSLPATATSAPTSTPATGPAKVKLMISRETTYIDGPFCDDGLPNYFEYLRAKASKGVTKDNNAAVLLLKAVGPLVLDEGVRAARLAELGLTGLAEKGEYLAGADEYAASLAAGPDSAQPADLKKVLTTMPGEDSAREFGNDQFEQAMSEPWQAKDHPLMAQWLKANDKQIDLLVQASSKSRYYMPMIGTSRLPMVMDVMVPNLAWARMAAKALAIRAYLRAGEGDFAAASADILAIHRLGRLIAQEPVLISYLVAVAIDSLAFTIETNLATTTAPKTDDILKHLAEVQKMGAFPYPTAAFESERLFQLDMLVSFYRGGPGVVESMMSVGEAAPKMPEGWPFIRSRIDWDELMREFNKWDDRLAAGIAHDAYADRAKAADKISADLREVRKQSGEMKGIIAEFAGSTLGAMIGRKPSSAKLSATLINIMLPSLGKISELCDWSRQQQDLACVGLAIAAYKADTGKYPAKLDDLSPKYLKQIPADRFTDKPLVYKLTEKGYILYSFGPNMKDDNGTPQDQGDGENWDFVVTAP